jgi:predicted nucleic acid-binding protein
MAILLDADVIIRGEKRRFELRRWLSSRADEQFEIAAITIAELWHGVERATSQHRAVREAYLRTVISALPIVPYTEQTAYVHARLWADVQARGAMIGYYDLIVAATALERGSEVATFNRRHFSAVPGLRVVEPA